MKWFDKWFAKKCQEAWNNSRAEKSAVPSIVGIEYDNRPDEEPILTFRIYSANNGQILEFRRYDRKTDRSNNSTYIIEKDKDIGEYVGKVLSLELLK